ncbi:hypothetical protein DBV15_06281 [Temnothorax longispinosus]|uniref:Peptidase S1 domain-containing protein n=1 Tax=Temnothorax longispinosus TaxID=300112 RepID=A0A4S2KII2_9HYME|nr:hypothetical protein DBV15_06281 [Temnothorax longispinosus]
MDNENGSCAYDGEENAQLSPLQRLPVEVVGGEPAPEGAYPYIVSLHAYSQHFCAGSTLNERWIITAANKRSTSIAMFVTNPSCA